MFALLDQIGDPGRLVHIWARLAVLLEVHADAEERYFYPRLLHVGTGAGGADSAAGETNDAIRDHNEIRDAIREAGRYHIGSDQWWRSVSDARIANSDHMAEEEREALADFRRHTTPQGRHDLALEFAVFEAAHASGVRGTEKDPAGYVEREAT